MSSSEIKGKKILMLLPSFHYVAVSPTGALCDILSGAPLNVREGSIEYRDALHRLIGSTSGDGVVYLVGDCLYLRQVARSVPRRVLLMSIRGDDIILPESIIDYGMSGDGRGVISFTTMLEDGTEHRTFFLTRTGTGALNLIEVEK